MTGLEETDAKGLLSERDVFVRCGEPYSAYPFSQSWHDRCYGFAPPPTPAGTTS